MKAETRRRLKAVRDAIPERERAEMSAELCRLIESAPEYESAELVLLYRPFGSEPDIMPLLFDALCRGKRTAFPVTRGSDVTFHLVDGAEGFVRGAMGILEPDADICPPVSDYSNAICVVPALAVDSEGNRIGYGGGCYDRFLSGFDGFSVCAVFPQLVTETLPKEPHDVRVDAAAIAGSGIVRFR